MTDKPIITNRNTYSSSLQKRLLRCSREVINGSPLAFPLAMTPNLSCNQHRTPPDPFPFTENHVMPMLMPNNTPLAHKREGSPQNMFSGNLSDAKVSRTSEETSPDMASARGTLLPLHCFL